MLDQITEWEFFTSHKLLYKYELLLLLYFALAPLVLLYQHYSFSHTNSLLSNDFIKTHHLLMAWQSFIIKMKVKEIKYSHDFIFFWKFSPNLPSYLLLSHLTALTNVNFKVYLNNYLFISIIYTLCNISPYSNNLFTENSAISYNEEKRDTDNLKKCLGQFRFAWGRWIFSEDLFS